MNNKLIYQLLCAAILLGLTSCGQSDVLTESPESSIAESEISEVGSTPDQISERSSTGPAKPSTGEATGPTEPQSSESEPASAQTTSSTSPVPLEKKDCGELETQQAMNQCAADNYKISDELLNQVYQQIRRGLNEGAKQQLTDAEERWITFRDTECAFESQYFEGGSIATMIQASCMEQITDNRIAELQESPKPETSFESADTQLNQVYQVVQALADDAQGEALTDVQLSWLDYRDAHCEYEAALPSGADVKTCMAAITETRVWQLQALKDKLSL